MAKTRDEREAISSIRETLESIWVAVVLAFVLRAFVLEAFVIPTGSMAPRLMGQHWQFDCPACKYSYDRGDQTAYWCSSTFTVFASPSRGTWWSSRTRWTTSRTTSSG